LFMCLVTLCCFVLRPFFITTTTHYQTIVGVCCGYVRRVVLAAVLGRTRFSLLIRCIVCMLLCFVVL